MIGINLEKISTTRGASALVKQTANSVMKSGMYTIGTWAQEAAEADLLQVLMWGKAWYKVLRIAEEEDISLKSPKLNKFLPEFANYIMMVDVLSAGEGLDAASGEEFLARCRCLDGVLGLELMSRKVPEGKTSPVLTLHHSKMSLGEPDLVKAVNQDELKALLALQFPPEKVADIQALLKLQGVDVPIDELIMKMFLGQDLDVVGVPSGGAKALNEFRGQQVNPGKAEEEEGVTRVPLGGFSREELDSDRPLKFKGNQKEKFQQIEEETRRDGEPLMIVVRNAEAGKDEELMYNPMTDGPLDQFVAKTVKRINAEIKAKHFKDRDVKKAPEAAEAPKAESPAQPTPPATPAQLGLLARIVEGFKAFRAAFQAVKAQPGIGR